MISIRTTSTTPIIDYAIIFSQVGEITSNTVYVVLHKDLSATWEFAKKAQEMLNQKSLVLLLKLLTLRTGLHSYDWTDIEVMSDKYDKPLIKLGGEAQI